ncbi:MULTISPECIES: 5'-methylthioadenosine/adenosylhomocysteine nucleosidase [Caproicibacterium]|uniref:adenosylhomocysteine nucleosidase n=1 Tax=Caproicibacterium argilliputei TaxID=3030016 RepID=A0AA97H1Y6_9FIRM|nr:5'-methylthioadenosine/adenosylhomocysteine nucleosidase [Caproicibacterium argilliputei]WOC31772.1 5'-methylthioadenosine/adenosylhomocysteine nucleosidase [Caproicibacterium argilliputei]
MIGIIGAMEVEVEQLLEHMQQTGSKTMSGICFHEGIMAGVECVVAQCGIGKVAAAVCTQTMIFLYQPQAVLFEGVAGGIGKDVHIGDLVVATSLVQHDMDTSALGDPVGYISALKEIFLPVPEKTVNLLADCAEAVYQGHVCKGVIATGDQFIADNAKMHQLAEDFGAVACEMEGGSMAQVCCMAGVNYAVLRSISDNGDDGAAVDFPTFAEESAHKNTALLLAALPKLAKQMENV